MIFPFLIDVLLSVVSFHAQHVNGADSVQLCGSLQACYLHNKYALSDRELFQSSSNPYCPNDSIIGWSIRCDVEQNPSSNNGGVQEVVSQHSINFTYNNTVFETTMDGTGTNRFYMGGTSVSTCDCRTYMVNRVPQLKSDSNGGDVEIIVEGVNDQQICFLATFTLTNNCGDSGRPKWPIQSHEFPPQLTSCSSVIQSSSTTDMVYQPDVPSGWQIEGINSNNTRMLIDVNGPSPRQLAGGEHQWWHHDADDSQFDNPNRMRIVDDRGVTGPWQDCNPAPSFPITSSGHVNIPSDAAFSIVAKHSNMPLRVANIQSQESPVAVFQSTTSNDHWMFQSTGDAGYYYIISTTSGKGLTVQNRSTSSGYNIIQYFRWAYVSDEWSVIPRTSDSYYGIVNRKSGLCISVQGGSVSNGANIIQLNDVAGDHQSFKIQLNLEVDSSNMPPTNVPTFHVQPYTGFITVPASTTFYILAQHSNLPIQVAHNASKTDRFVYQSTSAEGWTFHHTMDGFHNIKSTTTGDGLNVNNSSNIEGAAISLWPTTNHNSDEWSLIYRGNGYYGIINRHSQMAVSVPGGSMADGAGLVQLWDVSADYQSFKIEPVALYELSNTS